MRKDFVKRWQHIEDSSKIAANRIISELISVHNSSRFPRFEREIAAVMARSGYVDLAFELAKGCDAEDMIPFLFNVGVCAAYKRNNSLVDKVLSDMNRFKSDSHFHRRDLYACRACVLELSGRLGEAFDSLDRAVVEALSEGSSHPLLVLCAPFVISEAFQCGVRAVKVVKEKTSLLKEDSMLILAREDPVYMISLDYQYPLYFRERVRAVALATIAQSDITKALQLVQGTDLGRLMAYCAISQTTSSSFLPLAEDAARAVSPLVCDFKYFGFPHDSLYVDGLVNYYLGLVKSPEAAASHIERIQSDYQRSGLVFSCAGEIAKCDIEQAINFLRRYCPKVREYAERHMVDGLCTVANRVLEDTPRLLLGGINNQQLRLGH